jgi:hypothetical protein
MTQKEKRSKKEKGVEIWKTLKGVSHIPTPQTTTINHLIKLELPWLVS